MISFCSLDTISSKLFVRLYYLLVSSFIQYFFLSAIVGGLILLVNMGPGTFCPNLL